MPFFGKLHVEHTGEDWKGLSVFRTSEKFGYALESRGFALEVDVPEGTKTDFGSVPRLVRYWYPSTGPWAPATVVHDLICEGQPCGWFLAHAIMWQALCELPRVTWWNRFVITVCVVLFGPKWRYKPITPSKKIPAGSLDDMPTEKLPEPPPSEKQDDPIEVSGSKVKSEPTKE